MRLTRLFKRRDDGAAAVEFALIAPILTVGVLATADIGFAIHESFEIDQALRNGAELVADDPGAAAVEAVLAAVDETGAGRYATTYAVNRVCACPAATGVPVACNTVCASDRPTSIFYDLTGVRTYPGIILPPRDLERSMRAQAR